jgi:hypothetical protein
MNEPSTDPWNEQSHTSRKSNPLHPQKADLADVEPGQARHSQQMTTSEGKPRADKGLGHFPISDMQFDVVTVVMEKSKALQAYDNYIRDAQANEELLDIFEKIAADDRKHIERLKNFLGKC